MAASMKYIPREQDGLILANFTHGRLNVPEEGGSSETPNFKCYKHTDQGDKRRKHQRIVVAESNSMNYVGQNYGIHAPKHSSNCKYLVGVLDKKRGKMKVFDAQSFHLRPWFGESKGDEESVNATNNEKLSTLQKNDRLTEAFGSSRKQRALESRLRSAVTSQALETLANKAVKHAQSQPASAVKPDEADSGSILPPRNKKAQILNDVYDLNDIISPVCMEMLREVADTSVFLEATKEQITEWRTEEKYCDYILGHLEKLPTKAEDKQQRVCILVYMHYLRKMYAINQKDLKAKKVVVAEDLPDAFNQHFLDNFTQMSASVDGVRKQRSFPQKLKEKVLVRMLTLALLIDDFKTDLGHLQKGLTAQMYLFRNHARALGCKVKVTSAKVPKVSRKLGVHPLLAAPEEPKPPAEDQITAELILPSKFTKQKQKFKR
ncbi:DNA-directed RNA polymerase I subunit RPA49-like isoform X2 [Patiria miniata]|uniref:DNA-directed RNA polymerase I subunit RPA49 n=1 Tax=Patiria miniata TaxID=46514 RepID=A0A913ZW15_PATMI|nr:DNA-directed RNA polymerase I subunit RPA49-like isoform X2 [Patiria miniata]